MIITNFLMVGHWITGIFIPVGISTFKTEDIGFSDTKLGCDWPDSVFSAVSRLYKYKAGRYTRVLYTAPTDPENTIKKYIAIKKVRIIFFK